MAIFTLQLGSLHFKSTPKQSHYFTQMWHFVNVDVKQWCENVVFFWKLSLSILKCFWLMPLSVWCLTFHQNLKKKRRWNYIPVMWALLHVVLQHSATTSKHRRAGAAAHKTGVFTEQIGCILNRIQPLGYHFVLHIFAWKVVRNNVLIDWLTYWLTKWRNEMKRQLQTISVNQVTGGYNSNKSQFISCLLSFMLQEQQMQPAATI